MHFLPGWTTTKPGLYVWTMQVLIYFISPALHLPANTTFSSTGSSGWSTQAMGSLPLKPYLFHFSEATFIYSQNVTCSAVCALWILLTCSCQQKQEDPPLLPAKKSCMTVYVQEAQTRPPLSCKTPVNTLKYDVGHFEIKYFTMTCYTCCSNGRLQAPGASSATTSCTSPGWPTWTAPAAQLSARVLW